MKARKMKPTLSEMKNIDQNEGGGFCKKMFTSDEAGSKNPTTFSILRTMMVKSSRGFSGLAFAFCLACTVASIALVLSGFLSENIARTILGIVSLMNVLMAIIAAYTAMVNMAKAISMIMKKSPEFFEESIANTEAK
jgi:hypothetical protein